MHGYSGGIWDWPTDGEDSLILLGEPLYVGTSRKVLCNPVQGTLVCHPGGYPVPHHLQHGGGSIYFSLCRSGRKRGGGTRLFWMDNLIAGDALYADYGILP